MLLCLFFIAGVFLVLCTWGVAILIFIVLSCVAIKLHKPLYILTILCGLAYAQCCFAYQYNKLLPGNYDNQTLYFISHIEDIIQYDNHTNILLRTENLIDKLDLRINATLPENIYNEPLYIGCKLNVLARLRSIHTNVNVHTNDSFYSQLARKIHAKARIIAVENVDCVNNNSYFQQLRQQIISKINKYTEKSYVNALVFGDNSAISPSEWQILSNTGTTHLMVISGTHIGFLAYILFRFLLITMSYLSHINMTRLGISLNNRWLFASIFTMIGILFYSYLADFNIPVIRSLIASCIIIYMNYLGFTFKAVNLWILALFIVLIINPLAIFNAGFYLSFVASLILILTINKFHTKYNILINFALIQFNITIGLLPVLYVFHIPVSWVSMITNFIATPFVVTVAIPLCLLAVMLSIANVNVSYIFDFVNKLIKILFFILQQFSQLDLTFGAVFVTPLNMLFMFIAVVAYFTYKDIFLKIFSLFMLIPSIATGKHLNTYDLRVNIMDVGQGNSILIQTKNFNILYDAAWKYKEYDRGKSIVLPVLKFMHVGRIDKFIISHADVDHAGGAKSIIQEMQVDDIITSSPQLLQEKFNINASKCVQERFIKDQVVFEIWQYQYADNDNDASCVLMVTSRDNILLITGDLGEQGESQLVTEYPNLNVTALIAGHHGSRTSSSSLLLKAIKAKYAFISAGRYNQYKHPHHSVIARFKEHDIKILSTIDDGAIIWQPGSRPYGLRYKISPWFGIYSSTSNLEYH